MEDQKFPDGIDSQTALVICTHQAVMAIMRNIMRTESSAEHLANIYKDQFKNIYTEIYQFVYAEDY